MPDRILAGLDPEQRAVAEAVRGPVCVLAGAGTGKTRAITCRIAHAIDSGAVDPRHVLAVTFTTRAAGELRARLRQLAGAGPAAERVRARTFHAAALRQLVYFWPKAVGGPPPRVIESKLSLIAEAARALRLKLDGAALRDVASEIEWAKATQCRPEDLAGSAEKAGRVPPVPLGQLAQLFGAYERLRRERHVVDFESVLELTAGILADHKPAAAQVHDQYRYFVVDEYQDVNPLQKLVLDAWLGGRDDVCVVGDPNQTIYSFTGATPAFLTGFTAEFPGAAVVKLVRAYRSTRQVVRLANRLIATAGPGSRRPGPQPPAHAGPGLVAQRGDGPEPVFAEYPDEETEAAAVAAQTREMIGSGLAARQIAVLVRTNAQTEIFECAMRAAGVPYALRGAERFFDRPEVRQALVLLRAAAKTEPSGSPRATAGHVFAGLGLTQEPPPAGGAMRDRWESLTALATLADEYFAAQQYTTLTDFAVDLTERAALQDAPAAGGVTIASLHAAKGLEWDAVFLPGLVDGVLPIVYAKTPDAIEEERRLLYVGLTRAKSRLLLSWSMGRSPDARRSRRPSPFLGPLLAAAQGAGRPGAAGHRSLVPEPADSPRPQAVLSRLPGCPGGSPPGHSSRNGSRAVARPATADAARPGAAGRLPGAASGSLPRCSVCGRALSGAAERKLGRCGTCPAQRDEILYSRLIQWRAASARERGIPAYVVFTDVTLQAIAERRPRSAAELAAVPGVGRIKMDRYGADVLGLCRPAAPAQAAAAPGDTVRPAGAVRSGRVADPGGPQAPDHRRT